MHNTQLATSDKMRIGQTVRHKKRGQTITMIHPPHFMMWFLSCNPIMPLRTGPYQPHKEGKQNLLEDPQKQHLALFLPQAHQLLDHTPIHIHHKRTSS